MGAFALPIDSKLKPKLCLQTYRFNRCYPYMVQFFVHSYYLVNVLLVLRWVYGQLSAPAPAASPTKLKKETVTKKTAIFVAHRPRCF